MLIELEELTDKKSLVYIDELFLGQNKDLEINCSDRKHGQPLSVYSDQLYRLLDNELFHGVWLVNMPFCVLSENCSDHIYYQDGFRGEKIPECHDCKYNARCKGFPLGYINKFGNREMKPINDIPTEVMLEIESKCNFKCEFCYNHNSFAKDGRDLDARSTSYWKKVIDGIADNGIAIVRFTGGEPLLRNDIFDLMRYSKERGLEVRLNTNSSLVSKSNIKKFQGILDNVLIPIESHSEKYEERTTVYPGALEKKKEAIRLFSLIGVPVIRVGTVISGKLLKNFSAITDLVLGLPVHEWEFYRPVSIRPGGNFDVSAVSETVNQIFEARKQTDKKISIANAIPFCALPDLKLLNSASSGALFEDGHNRIVVDPRGFVKPHYFIDKDLGDPLFPRKAWQDEFMVKMRNLEYIPDECGTCRYRFKCRGGSRHEALIKSGSITAPDPLADFNNCNKYGEG